MSSEPKEMIFLLYSALEYYVLYAILYYMLSAILGRRTIEELEWGWREEERKEGREGRKENAFNAFEVLAQC